VTRAFQPADIAAPDAPPSAPLRAVANMCAAGSCPTVYEIDPDSDMVAIQGFAMSAEHVGIDLPDGELLVRIPYGLLLEAVRNLS
jgi:hypothetical protein